MGGDFEWKPEQTDLLILANQMGLCDSKGKAPNRFSFQFHTGKILLVHPDLSVDLVDLDGVQEKSTWKSAMIWLTLSSVELQSDCPCPHTNDRPSVS